MGQPHLKTLLQKDNSTAEGVVNKNVQSKHTKAINMQFHWFCGCEVQQQF